MSRVVNNNRGFLQLLAACPAYQRQFLLKTATPQQLHADSFDNPKSVYLISNYQVFLEFSILKIRAN